MIQIYNDQHKRIGGIENLDDLKIVETLSSGDKQLEFSYPKNGAQIENLRPEYYIRTKEDEYVVKEISTGETKNSYVAQLNIEELEATQFLYGFSSITQTAQACLEFAFEGTGWKVGVCTVEKRRTVDIEETCSAWEVLQEVLDTYRCECKIDSITKTVDIYEVIGVDRGAYFIEGLNLRKLTLKSDTYDFYTRIYPVGKDGITPEIILGVPYIDNHQYSDKIIARYWKDERYTVTANLIEDATAKVEEASKPYTAYTADVADLAAQSDEYSVLQFSIGDTVWLVSKTERTKEKQRIVKLTRYPDHPEKNTCELSSVSKTFAQLQEETEEKVLSDAVEKSAARTKKTLNEGYWTTEQAQAAITASEERLTLAVSSARTESRDLSEKAQLAAQEYAAQMNEKVIEKMTNEYTTAIQQEATNVNISISSLEETVTSQGDEFETFRRENETYFHYTDEGMEIGKKQDGGTLPFSTLLSDKRLEFRQDGNAVAYVQYNKLHIENVEAVKRWSVGAEDDGGFFDFISTQYGMGVKWREAEETVETASVMAAAEKRSVPEEYEQMIDDTGVFEVVSV